MFALRRLGLFLLDRNNDYQALLQQDCQRAALQHRLELTTFSAENSLNRQLGQIRSALEGNTGERPDAVLVSPVSETALVPTMHAAARAGVAWVFVNRWHDMINDLRWRYPAVPIFSVSADQEQIGALHGRQIMRLWQPGDECVYLQGPLGTSSAKKRLLGAQSELTGSNVKLTILHCGDWSRASGKDVMAQWLRMVSRTPPNGFFIVAQNDDMAIGAHDALADWRAGRANRGQSDPELLADVVGCDGLPDFGQHWVKTGRFSATVVIPPVTGPAIAQLRAAEAGTRPDVVTRVSVEPYPTFAALRSLRG